MRSVDYRKFSCEQVGRANGRETGVRGIAGWTWALPVAWEGGPRVVILAGAALAAGGLAGLTSESPYP